MMVDEQLLSRARKMIETKLGWGDSADWSNHDFLELSRRILEETNISVSHVTLKRIWGKVKYDSLPNNYTLSSLVKFIGYDNWRAFTMKNAEEAVPETSMPAQPESPATTMQSRRFPVKPLGLIVLLLVCGAIIFFAVSAIEHTVDPVDYSFSSRVILTKGVPNSVVFDFDAAKAPTDSVIIQQSWDSTLRTRVSKNDRQHTLLYYFPGFFQPKLIVKNQVVKEHNLLVPSDGWVTAIETSPVPVYVKEEDVMAGGEMSLSVEKIKARNISLTPQALPVLYSNVKDFGEIYTDDFVFETSLKNDYRDGSAACQTTNIYLLCEGTAIGIPLCAKGCISGVNLIFAGFSVSGKQQDLSAFGVDFTDFVKVRIESKGGKAMIFLNDKLAYKVEHDIGKAKIVGIDFVFQGTGTVDYVKMFNKAVSFQDNF